jgi:hypothetical protein
VASRVPGVPKGTYVSRVVASRAGEGAAFATFDGHRSEDYGVYLYVTNDYGESWKAIRNGIPDSAGTVHVLREHPRNQNLLFAGLEFGLWVSWDRGANWTALKNNLPTVPVDDIQIQGRENDLVLATHGRSIWILDDITAIEKLDATVLNGGMTFFQPHPGITFNIRQRRWSGGQKSFTAKNPPYGVILNYYLKEALPPEAPKTEQKADKESKEKSASAKTEEREKEKSAIEESKSSAEPKKEGKVKFTVTDKSGKVVREFDGPGGAGVNRASWDLRYNPAAEPTPEQMEAIAAGYAEGPRGPRVDPGTYTIKIKAGTNEATREVVVEDDPLVQISTEDREARRRAIDQLYAMEKTAAKDRKTMQELKDALNAARGQWKADANKPDLPKIPEEIQKAADELQKKVDKVAEKYIRDRGGLGNAGPPLEWKPDPLPEQVQRLLQDLDGFSAAPGGQQEEKLAELSPLVSDASAQVKKLIDEDLAALNKRMNEAGIPHIVPKPAERRRSDGDGEESDR